MGRELPGCARRDLEVHATVVVGFVGGREVEIGEQDLVGPVRGEVKECIAEISAAQKVARKICAGATIHPATLP